MQLQTRLQYRFPVTALHVVAALLDPSQRNLGSVQTYLMENEVMAVDVLRRSLQKYVDDTREQSVADGSGSEHLVEEDNAPPSWKQAQFELLSRHVSSVATFDQQLQQYRCQSVSADDMLSQWSTQQQTFSCLSMLANSILLIPATSTPSERVSSTAG
jgi:hypothetical protein